MKKILFAVLFFAFQNVSAQVYTDFIGAGNNQDIVISSSDSQSNADKSLDGSGLNLDLQGSSRFLAHATLGPTIEEIKYLTEIGMESWIEEQMQLEGSDYLGTTYDIIYLFYDQCIEVFGADVCPNNFNLNTTYWRYAWWHNFMTSNDRLRQRMALALSEILVISDQTQLGNVPHGMAAYYDILSKNAFGNYRDLLEEVTLNISMGFYLSHLNNPLSIPSLNIHPDENYAREIMQLFSIGLYELNIDGSRKTDPDTGLWIPTYDNEDIKGLAKVFTGLSGGAWADPNNVFPVEFGRGFFRYAVTIPMQMFEQWHEKGPKTIVGGHTIPDGQSGMEDVQEALDVLFNHPNVGPFLGTQLIQRFVKSNPSPEYVQRVAEVFNDNGNGVRGDLGAVLKTILLDEEALTCYWMDDMTNGALREPILRLTQLMKGLKAETESEWFFNSGFFFQEFTEQHPLSSPTVFNFYVPDYVPDSEFAYYNMVGPEYQILNSATSSNYVNFMLFALMKDYLNNRYNIDLINVLNEPFQIRYFDNVRQFAAELSDPLWLDLADSPEDMVDYLDLLLANGNLSEDTKASIVTSVKRRNILDPISAAHYAAYMIMIHPDYLIMK